MVMMWKRLLEFEIKVLIFIQQLRRTCLLRWIRYFVSSSSTSDIAIFNYVGAMVQMPSRGFKTVWLILFGVIMKGLVNFLAPNLPIPSNVNRNLEMLTGPCYGIVSSETFFASLIFSQCAMESQSAAFAAIYIAIATFIGLTRICATSHYPHQVATGMFLGCGVTLIFRILFPTKVSLGFNILGLILFGGIILLQWTLAIENNETRHFGVRRKEYIDVLGSILNAEAENHEPRGTASSHFDYRKLPSSPKRTQKKKDSFFYLTQNLKKRRMGRDDDGDFESKYF